MLLKRLTGLLLLLVAATTPAQDTDLPKYQVEILVVRNLNPSTGSELFPLTLEREESKLPAENFIATNAAELELTDMVGKIGRSRNFRPLSHSGWTQPGFGRDEARRKIFLRTMRTGETVSGHVVLTRERYLRLALDLTLEVDGELFRLETQRRMISRQVHYFDSPHFGVIAKITPL